MYVRQFMTSQVFTVSPDESIADTLALMREKKIDRLPVLEKGKLVGFVTDGDLREVSPSPATTLSIFELNYLIAKTPIREVAVKKVVTCHPDTRIEDAALLMREHKIGGLPVLEEGKLVGIITGYDILGAFLDIMGSRSPGERVVIEAKDKIGVLLDIATTIKHFDVDVTSFAFYHQKDNHIQFLVHLNGEQVNEAKVSLEEKGYNIKN
ncbi:CBS domain-containing protein [Desulfosporosinus sp. BICA1-9]|uniref:CBS domain-containing protein n=1 Tax=Desulfosporosinus sp. BICA1-9 TaxID=1531958 RepID=UPI00054C1871|nr:CBS domain-containing protein [Desulfosporosinus sp. BICA1-9]KJS47604.1 MAG: acetoin utilization protein [Peptococcaceae bacterium BRH_c23]KJS89666.1 MAG: acetoin utilization protein [Desulfosporosinus sp. BICA1-9]HBW37124.1 CBS domain-containing protein [Desulfosporosinus sp.]